MVAVAVVYLATSFAEGGYSPEATAAGTLLIWWAVIVGLAVGAWPRAAVPRAAIAAGVCIAGLGLLTALSVVWASDDGGAFVEVVRVAGYTGLFALVLLASPEGSARSWLIGLTIGLVGVAAIALGSRFEPSLPGGDARIGEFIPDAKGRLSYPIGYWNALAACMALATVLLVWWGARAHTRTGRAVAIGALPPVMLTIYLASSRGGVAAAAVGLVVLIALGPARARMTGGLAIAATGGALLIAATALRSPLVDDPGSPVARFAGDEILLATLIAASAVGLARYLVDAPLARLAVPPDVARAGLIVLGLAVLAGIVISDPIGRFNEFKETPTESSPAGSYGSDHLTGTSGSGRYQFWSVAVDAFREDPLTGIGAGGYEAFWNENGSIPRVLRDAHSLFLETLGELGIGGVLLIIGFLALGAVHGWRRKAGGSPGGVVEVTLAVLAAGVFSAAIDWTWELPAAFGPVVVAVALLVGAATLFPGSRPTHPPDGAQPSRRSFGWGVATLLAGWIAVWVAGILLLTEIKLDDSRDAEDRGDLAAATQEADDASTLQPWAAEPHLQLAVVEHRAGNLPAARAEIAEAIDRAPDDWLLWYFASRIEASAGDAAAAAEAFERARALNPRAPIFQSDGEQASTP